MGNLASLATLSVEISITKKMYGWTKYGGARHGLVKTDDDVWYCQACGEEQVKEIPGYMYEINDREYLRLCAKCWAAVLRGMTLREIIRATRNRKRVWRLMG